MIVKKRQKKGKLHFGWKLTQPLPTLIFGEDSKLDLINLCSGSVFPSLALNPSYSSLGTHLNLCTAIPTNPILKVMGIPPLATAVTSSQATAALLLTLPPPSPACLLIRSTPLPPHVRLFKSSIHRTCLWQDMGCQASQPAEQPLLPQTAA